MTLYFSHQLQQIFYFLDICQIHIKFQNLWLKDIYYILLLPMQCQQSLQLYYFFIHRIGYVGLCLVVFVKSLSDVQLFATPCTEAPQASLSFTISQSLTLLMSIELVILSYHLTLCFPFLLLPSIFPSIRVFSNKSPPHIRWPKYWSFSFSISPSSKYSGLIPFRIDWLELLAVQGTLKSLLQHHNSKASILQGSAFLAQTRHRVKNELL